MDRLGDVSHFALPIVGAIVGYRMGGRWYWGLLGFFAGGWAAYLVFGPWSGWNRIAESASGR